MSWIIESRSASLTVGVFCILYTAKNLLSYYNTKWQNNYAYHVAARISGSRLLNYLNGDFSVYSSVHSSSQFMSISQVPVEFGHYVLRGALLAAGQIFLIALSLTAIFIYNAGLFSLLILILLPPALIVHLLIKRKVLKLRSLTKSAGAVAHKHLTEALNGFVESKIYEQPAFFSSRFISAQKAFNTLLARQQSIQALPSKILEACCISAMLLLMLVNKLAFGSLINIVTIGAFVAAAYKIMPAVVKLTAALAQIRAYQHTIPESLNNPEDPVFSTLLNRHQSVNKVECRKVCFRYQDQLDIKDFDMELNRGELVGLSAPSGMGKTTIINLILGFLSPDSGEVLMNNIHCLKPSFQLFSGIAYVKQSSFLINDSLTANIVLGNQVDKEKLALVLHLSGLDQCFTAEEYEQMIIGEHGRNISGGQRQRVALARALYHDFDFLILDEPFSELDHESEMRLIHYLLKQAVAGKIILLVTHNKESLSYCHKVIRLYENKEKSFNYTDARIS